MKLYRICTENKNYPNILDYLDKHFPDGYTVIKDVCGAWHGKREKSLVIEITFNTNEPTTWWQAIEHFAYWLKKHNNQQSVLVQIVDVKCWNA